MGADGAEHSTNYEELAKNEGKYDVVLSTLFINDPVVYKLHQRLTKPGGVYIMVGVPEAGAPYEVDLEYLTEKEITVAGTIVGSIHSVK